MAAIDNEGETHLVLLCISRFSLKACCRNCLCTGSIRLSYRGCSVLLTKHTISVRVDRILSQPFSVNACLPQGPTFASTLFALFINDLSKSYSNSPRFCWWCRSALLPFLLKCSSNQYQHQPWPYRFLCIACLRFRTSLCLGSYQTCLFQSLQDSSLFCSNQISTLFSSPKFGLEFCSFHWITSTNGFVHKFFSLLVSFCVGTPSVLRTKLFFYSVPDAFIHPPTSFFYTKLKSVRHLNNAVMCGAELYPPLILFLIGFKEKPFVLSVAPHWRQICSYLLIVFYFLSLLFSFHLFWTRFGSSHTRNFLSFSTYSDGLNVELPYFCLFIPRTANPQNTLPHSVASVTFVLKLLLECFPHASPFTVCRSIN